MKVKKAKYEMWDKNTDKLNLKPIKIKEPEKISKARKKPYIVIECWQDIPCNPCEVACPFNAITIGKNITDIPLFYPDKCTGCMTCITKCPGLAIFGITQNIEKGKVAITIPYELLPLPEKGDEVWAADRDGKILTSGKVYRIRKNKNKTQLVTIVVDEKYKNNVRHFYPKSKGDVMICRCMDVTAGEIEKAIDESYTDFEELKRYLRITTGPCQGRGCRQLIMGMIRSRTGVDISKSSTGTKRPPESAIPFSAFSRHRSKK